MQRIVGIEKKTFPRVIALLCAALLALSLGGCGLGAAGPSTGNTASSTSSVDTSGGTGGNAGSSGNAGNSTGTSSTPKKLAEGDKAPDFSFATTAGTNGKLSDYSGKVVFINFWASWCPPCMQEMPDINELRGMYPDVVILEVNVSDEKSDALAFIEEAGYDVHWIIDDGAISKLYPTSGIPYTLVLDKSGTISTIFEGSAPNMISYFESAVKKAGATK